MAKGGYSHSKVVLLGVKAAAAQFQDMVNERILAEKFSESGMRDARELRRAARELLARTRKAAQGGP